MENGQLIATFLGVVGSTTIHLSQGLMRLGILQRQTSRGSLNRTYFAGLALNLTAPVWVIVANRYAPTVFFTSMYAIGLIPLLLFSCWKLGESLRATHVFGTVLLTAGAAMIAVEQGIRSSIEMYQLKIWIIALIGGIWLLGAPLVALVTGRYQSDRAGLGFGVLGGGFLALDSLFKGVAQAQPEGSTFLPQSSGGWLMFGLSFIGAAGALGMTQWAYHNRYRVSVVIAGYDMAYVSLPILLITVAAMQPTVSGTVFLGLGLLVSGTWLIVPDMTPGRH